MQLKIIALKLLNKKKKRTAEKGQDLLLNYKHFRLENKSVLFLLARSCRQFISSNFNKPFFKYSIY